MPLLRKRLKIEGDETSTKYDQAVVDAVKKFQQGAGLNGDGVAGPATLRAMNGVQKRERTTDIIIANMDRWRWMPHDLGKNYVMVNIPEYHLRLFQDRKLYWETKIVVGKPTQATPIMTAAMKFITVNPTWNVPPSIIANEYLPAVRQDPERARAHGPAHGAEPRRHRAHLSAAGRPAMRSAASASISRTSSWSISTTRRTSTCSRMTSAPTATAACASRIR